MKKPPKHGIFFVDLGRFYFMGTKRDRQIVRLFENFKYDVNNSQHWRWLLGHLANLHLDRRGRGRPTKWDADARGTLVGQWLWLLKKKKLSGSRKEQAAQIKKHYELDPLYRDSSVEEIYKQLLRGIRDREREISSK